MAMQKNIDDIGRITIPKDLRRSLRWMDGDTIEIIPKEDGTVLLRKHEDTTISQLKAIRADWAKDEEVTGRIDDLISYIESK